MVSKKEDYFIYTSNVDGQFQKAGFPEDKIYECHGSIHFVQCTKCKSGIKSAKNLDFKKRYFVPTCDKCNSSLRPNIMMFLDNNWDDSRSSEQFKRYTKFKRDATERNKRIVVIEIGAGTEIPTVRHNSERLGMFNTRIIRINPREDKINYDMGVGISLGGLEAINKIIGGING